MGHHGTESPFNGDKMNEFKDSFKVEDIDISKHLRAIQESYNQQLGATKKFPDGKINEEDEGEIKVGFTISKGKLIMGFGKKIMWIGLTKEQVKEWAEYLLEKYKEMG